MSGLPPYVQWIWACSILAQLIVLVLLFLKGNFRKLPFFTAYVALNICQAGFVVILYSIWGTDSHTSFTLAWYSECVTLLAQALATTEILEITLRPYKGIWGLGWRTLAVTSAIVVTLSVLATRDNWAFAQWFELNRGYHLTFATALIVFLLLVRYYSIPVAATYKMILGGFCLYSCTEILINTILQALLRKGFAVHQALWQSVTMVSFVLVQTIWMAAVRRPLPVEDQQAALYSDSEYQRLAPEINEQLRQLNEKLLRLWKLEARPR
ncbi:MAG TPA: hypothetical protein VNH65_10775 [Candidatus Acidoferrum sp.]|nr:hypothetical protein [Candidatus Acidoferrum sp.]